MYFQRRFQLGLGFRFQEFFFFRISYQVYFFFVFRDLGQKRVFSQRGIGIKGCCVEGLDLDIVVFVSFRLVWDLVVCLDRLWEGIKRGFWIFFWFQSFLGKFFSSFFFCQVQRIVFRSWQMVVCGNLVCFVAIRLVVFYCRFRQGGLLGR